MKQSKTLLLCVAFALFCATTVLSQKTPSTGNNVLWEQIDISSRDLYAGPGGAGMQPDFSKAKFLGRQSGGNNLKYRVLDTTGHQWVVKIADESQPEVAAVRLLWGIGYPTEINYLVPKMTIASMGSYKNVRAEARPTDTNRGDRWSWLNNPFMNTREFDGLKLMMALMNNWDIKDENNVILQKGGVNYYVIADLGSSFGRGATTVGGRGGRSVNKPADYANSEFLKGVTGDKVEIAFKTYNDSYIKDIKLENARWVVGLLKQLSDKQIEDAFRAANYGPQDVKVLAQAFKARVNRLDQLTNKSV
jgi:hypothetical protein